MRLTALLATASIALMPALSLAAEWERVDSPYRMSEAYPEVPATCETAKYWIEHAPETDDRVSFAITGKLVQVEWDGALAYLIMCDEKDVQVMCVTYRKDGREVGDTVLSAVAIAGLATSGSCSTPALPQNTKSERQKNERRPEAAAGCVTVGLSVPVADIDKVSGNCCSRSHGR